MKGKVKEKVGVERNMGNQKISASLLTEGEVSGVVSLLTEVFEETEAQKRSLMDEGFYRWQYLETKSPVVVAWADNKQIGHYPLTTYSFKVGPDVGKAAVIQDLVTSRQFRKKGVFKLMGEKAMEIAKNDNYDLIYAFPNQNSFPGFIKHHGYTHLLTIPLFVCPVSLSGIVNAKFGALPLGWLFRPIDSIRRFFLMRKRGNVSVKEHDDVPKEIDELWESSKGSYKSILVRDCDYIKWRFRERPGLSYRIFTATVDGKIVGYAVLGSGKFFGLPTAVIMDFFVANGRAGNVGLSALIREMKRVSLQRGDALLLTATQAGLGVWYSLFRSGFLKVPGIANPRKLKLVVRSLTERAKKSALDKKGWFLTLADWDVL